MKLGIFYVAALLLGISIGAALLTYGVADFVKRLLW